MFSQQTSSRDAREPLGELPVAKSVWQIVHMDIWSPGGGKETQRGNKYVIAFCCAFSKYVVAYTMHNRLADTVAEIIVDRLCAKYGPPVTIVCDNAQEFVGVTLTRTFEIMGVACRLITPHCQTNP